LLEDFAVEKFMRVLSGSAGAVLLSAGIAFAGDLAAHAPPPAYDWAGFYAGGNLGGAFGKVDARTATIFDPMGASYFQPASPAAIAATGAHSMTPAGVTGGAQAGYNRQYGGLVVGAELDIGYLGLKGSRSGHAAYPPGAMGSFTVNSAVSTGWLVTARPRIGWALDNWLVYVTGGLAVGDVKGNFNFTDTNGATESGSLSSTRTGWAFGGGVEVGLQDRWAVKAEYLRVDLGSGSVTSANLSAPVAGGPSFPGNPFTHGVDATASLVRLGLNYRF
jgi:outer membrane immunogenic protein